MKWAELVFDLIKSLAWPAAVLTIAWWFRDNLRKKFPNLIKAGPSGVEFEVQKAVVVKKWSGELKELPGLARTPMMGQIEKSIHTELDLVDPDARTDLLVRHLAQSRLEAVFERIYGAIFGSQIAGLRELKASGGKVPLTEAVKFFGNTKSQHVVLPDVTFDAWLQYLKNFELVRVDASDVLITPLGSDFLLYLSSKALPRLKKRTSGLAQTSSAARAHSNSAAHRHRWRRTPCRPCASRSSAP